MNISGPAAVAKPEMLFYAPGDLTVTFQPLAFGGLAKNNNTPGQLHKCKLSGRVLRFLSGQTHHHCAQVIPVEDKRCRLNRWLGK